MVPKIVCERIERWFSFYTNGDLAPNFWASKINILIHEWKQVEKSIKRIKFFDWDWDWDWDLYSSIKYLTINTVTHNTN